MNKNLRNNIDKFYDEKEELDVFGLMDVAEIVVPQLDRLVDKLKRENRELQMSGCSKLYRVRQLDFCKYSGHEGCIVMAETWQRAKGIALDRFPYWEERGSKNIVVEEIEIERECIIEVY